ncbi:MAG: ATP-binding protein [Bacteroidales bacterium]|jgi:signal transduction histidine kinase|nr:ATP-binding protein [Bacteroidales bacterium]NMD02895.1 ATP-binding protein [Bacteroidales bacterium]HOU00965.1 ATP-binding protein [Bacteroidales bacterium]HQK66644.1 ATP-binding protein [Bacteroidales bacterium]
MLFLFLLAVLTGSGSLVYTRYLVKILKGEERKKVELWAQATIMINSADPEDPDQNLEFPFSIIENNTTIPVILTDANDSIISAGNFDTEQLRNKQYIKLQLERIRKKKDPIIIELGSGFINKIYYKDSIILTQLTYYPYVQMGIIILFIFVAYLAFLSSRKAADNQVWVSMSKETAHQLGTPTSSLAGWVEILQEKYPEVAITEEVSRDVERLIKITERFSRIGSKTVLKDENIIAVISHTIDYLKTRTSSKIKFTVDFDRTGVIIIPLHAALFEWVIENISKNAIDAMEGSGEITYHITETDKNILIDVTDTGKGIPKRAFRKIFNPGYSTKQRGWGVGLSLAKRIVEKFHSGRIYVRHSEPGIGSCIRIVMNKR